MGTQVCRLAGRDYARINREVVPENRQAGIIRIQIGDFQSIPFFQAIFFIRMEEFLVLVQKDIYNSPVTAEICVFFTVPAKSYNFV